MKRCIIISGGDLGDQKKIKLNITPDDLIVAADSGYLHALRLGITPHILLGDYDSMTLEEAGKTLTSATQVLRYQVEKDDTDTMLAVKVGLEHGCEEFILLGALGGRLDHTIANIQALKYLLDRGKKGMILAGDNTAQMLCDGSMNISTEEGFKFSLFSYSESCKGVTIEGAKYPLQDYTMTNGDPIGTSNQVQPGKTATVSVREGVLLIVTSFD